MDRLPALFITGLLSSIIAFIYMLPATAVIAVGAGMGLMTLMSGLLAAGVPSQFMGIIHGGQANAQAMLPFFQSNLMALLPAAVGFVPYMVVGFLLMMVALYFTPMAVLSYVASGNFGDAFALKKVYARAMNTEYFVTWLIVLIGVTAVLGSILRFVPVIGFGLAMFVGGVISYSLFGQIYKK
ncbi:MAG: DUF4013 domain-containing protein [archaeon]